MVYGPDSLPDDWDSHHIDNSLDCNPKNLLGLPKGVHATVGHMMRRGECLDEILAPYFAKRNEHFRQQSNLNKKHHSPYRNQSKKRVFDKSKKGRS
jgi:hypothetical protein